MPEPPSLAPHRPPPASKAIGRKLSGSATPPAKSSPATPTSLCYSESAKKPAMDSQESARSKNTARLFQWSVHFDLTSDAEVNAPVHDHRDHKTRSHLRAISLTVLFRAVDRLTEFVCVERVEHCGLV